MPRKSVTKREYPRERAIIVHTRPEFGGWEMEDPDAETRYPQTFWDVSSCATYLGVRESRILNSLKTGDKISGRYTVQWKDGRLE